MCATCSPPFCCCIDFNYINCHPLLLYGKEQQGHSAKHLLCFMKYKNRGFGMAWEWANDDIIYRFGETKPPCRKFFSTTESRVICTFLLFCIKMQGIKSNVCGIEFGHNLIDDNLKWLCWILDYLIELPPPHLLYQPYWMSNRNHISERSREVLKLSHWPFIQPLAAGKRTDL